jgi:drug/metabolite transporter (DMT)-like permease
MIALLYMTTVLIWGLTWYGIKLNLGVVPPEVSVAYRFFIAGAALSLFLVCTGKWKRASWRGHGYAIALAIFLFSTNYYFMYNATGLISSGVVAVLFTMSSVFNSLNSLIWFRIWPHKRFYAAALLGICGVVGLFWHDFSGLRLQNTTLLGIGLVLAGTFTFSVGNMVSQKLTQSKAIDLPNGVARSMLYGASFMAVAAYMQGKAFIFDPSLQYVGSLLFLAIPGSSLAFMTYLTLVQKIGAAKAAYSTVLFPLVALTVSTIFEGYQWSLAAGLGVGAILLGNVLLFVKWPRQRQP